MIYLFPFVMYLSWVTGFLERITSPFLKKYDKSLLKKRLIKIYKNNLVLGATFSFIILSALLFDILFLQVLNDVIYLVILFSWLSLQFLTRSKSVVTIFIAILLIFISTISNQFESIMIAEKAAAWAFMFLSGGLFMEMISLRKSKK